MASRLISSRSAVASIRLIASLTGVLGLTLMTTLTSGCSSCLAPATTDAGVPQPEGDGGEPEPTPDVPTPTVPTPDTPEPGVSPDVVPTPDTPEPGQPQPGTPTPDTPTPDTPTPDTPTPDTPTPEAEPPAGVVISPPAMAFEAIETRSGERQTITISNPGTAAVTVTRVALAASSEGFLVEPVVVPFDVAGGASTTVDVFFRPTRILAGVVTYQNDVVIETTLGGQTVVTVTGASTTSHNPCLRFVGERERFFDSGGGGQRDVFLENCGQTPIVASDISILAAPGQFEIRDEPGADPIGPGNFVNFRVRFEGDEDVSQLGLLVVTGGNGAPGAIAVAELIAGPGCPTVDVSGSSPIGIQRENIISGFSGTAFGISAEVRSPNVPFLNRPMTWVDTPALNGSGVFQGPLDAQSNAYVPTGGGAFAVTAVPTREGGDVLQGCPTSTLVVDAFPPVPQATVTLTWSSDEDLDLHLQQSFDLEGNFGTFAAVGPADNPFDCFWGAQHQTRFGVPGFFSDGAYYENDDVDGEGPETIQVAVINPNRSYKIGVRRHTDFNVFTEVSVTVTMANGDINEVSTVFPDENGGNGNVWVPFEIQSGVVEVVDEFE